MTAPLTLAHLTDAHLSLHGRLRPRDLLGKRALSALNWVRRRRRVHLSESAKAITADILDQAPDHVAMTGDAVNFGLPVEFERASEWLRSLGAPEDVSFVPGNHEAIHKGVDDDRMAAFGAFSTGDDGRAGYPFLRRRGDVALIGVSTCIPTRIGSAQGELGKAQLTRLGGMLAETRGMCRVILIHHPPSGPCKPRKHLRDRHAFAEVLGREGAELVLHGHNHLAQRSEIAGPLGPIAVLGSPSASARIGGKDDPAEWRLLSFTNHGETFGIRVQRRRLAANGAIEDAGTIELNVPNAANG